eukprot:74019_1
MKVEWSSYAYTDIMVLEYIYNNFRYAAIEMGILQALIMSMIIDDIKQVELILNKLQTDLLIQQSHGSIKFTQYGLNEYSALLKYEKSSNQAHSRMKKIRTNYNETHPENPITPTATDGNCLFNSVIEQIEPSTIKGGGPLILRETCVDLIADNIEAFQNIYRIHNAKIGVTNVTQFDVWLKNHKENGEFDENGIIFMIVLMALLNAPFQIR